MIRGFCPVTTANKGVIKFHLFVTVTVTKFPLTRLGGVTDTVRRDVSMDEAADKTVALTVSFEEPRMTALDPSRVALFTTM